MNIFCKLVLFCFLTHEGFGCPFARQHQKNNKWKEGNNQDSYDSELWEAKLIKARLAYYPSKSKNDANHSKKRSLAMFTQSRRYLRVETSTESYNALIGTSVGIVGGAGIGAVLSSFGGVSVLFGASMGGMSGAVIGAAVGAEQALFIADESPTLTPTALPSLNTSQPTPMPSPIPTALPSIDPTWMPLLYSFPSEAPSQHPTNIPPGTEPEPTADPSLEPTAEPTVAMALTTAPFMQQSIIPTSLPTHMPSSEPSTAFPDPYSSKPPTAVPADSTPASTRQPLPTPTTDPSAAPTVSPTINPTTDPSAAPTVSLTVEPTTDPSAAPTVSPTIDPTTDPSAAPTVSLTVEPTTDPSAAPTVSPTVDPTTDPSAAPTVSPTIDPTTDPTAAPTVSPTVDPTTDPSAAPTVSPTVDPTTDPSAAPTVSPTVEPTTDPSAAPTVSPTVEPTTDPSAAPTVSPTVDSTSEPSATPTVSPTIDPTSDPSALTSTPTTLPSTQVSALPTNSGPSKAPSRTPTASPTIRPSRSPVSNPTVVPTAAPTSQPTRFHAPIPQGATSYCIKTNYTAIVSTRTGICAATALVRQAFSAAVPADIKGRSNLFGVAVRLAFHDAGEVDVTSGVDLLGPDGCMALDGDSDGLTEETSLVNTVLEPIWQSVCDRIGRADFWVLVGKLAVEASASVPVSVPFQYGRRDNVACEGGGGRLPSGQADLAEISRVFVSQMGLTLSDAVTLIGAHSLGHTHVQHSGYALPSNSTGEGSDDPILNAWDGTPHQLDNDYFVKLTDMGWKSALTSSGKKSQWRHLEDPWIMLNADMALGFNISAALPTTQGPNQVCGPRTLTGSTYGCRDPLTTTAPSTWPLCLQYAANNGAFLQAFPVAFTKMTCVGYGVPAAVDGATATGKLGTLTHIDLERCPTP